MAYINYDYDDNSLMRENRTTCLVDGQVYEYDAMADYRNVELYDRLYYIGQGSIYSINGRVYDSFRNGGHFWSSTREFRVVEKPDENDGDGDLYLSRLGVRV